MRNHHARRTLHTAWVTPLVVATCGWGTVVWIANYEAGHPQLRGIKDSLIAIAALPTLALTVATIILTARNAWRTRQATRLRKRAELVRRQMAVKYAAGWRDAQALAAQLFAGRALEPLTVWGLVLHPGETAHLDVTADYSRLVPTPEGTEAWTEPQPVRVIATDKRLLCDMGRWASVWYHEISGFYPDLQGWSVALETSDGRAVLLVGPSVPLVAIQISDQIYGIRHALEHPAFEALLSS